MAEATRLRTDKDFQVPANRYGDDVEAVLIPEDELQDRIRAMADKVSEQYKDCLLYTSDAADA